MTFLVGHLARKCREAGVLLLYKGLFGKLKCHDFYFVGALCRFLTANLKTPPVGCNIESLWRSINLDVQTQLQTQPSVSSIHHCPQIQDRKNASSLSPIALFAFWVLLSCPILFFVFPILF